MFFRLRHMKVTKMASDELHPCPVRGILDQVGDKWSVLVILELAKERRGPVSGRNRGIKRVFLSSFLFET